MQICAGNQNQVFHENSLRIITTYKLNEIGNENSITNKFNYKS